MTRMTVSQNVHSIANIRLTAYSPNNCNAITLSFFHANNPHWADYELTIFDLDDEAALALVDALDDAHLAELTPKERIDMGVQKALADEDIATRAAKDETETKEETDNDGPDI